MCQSSRIYVASSYSGQYGRTGDEKREKGGGYRHTDYQTQSEGVDLGLRTYCISELIKATSEDALTYNEMR